MLTNKFDVHNILPGETISAMRRVDRNDATLTHLLVCEPPTTIRKDGPHFDIAYITNDGPSLKRLCDRIGKNSHLQDVCFDAPSGLSDIVANRNNFRGLRRNSSIVSVGLSRCELSHGVGYEVLKAFELNNLQLTKFAIWRCSIGFEGTHALSSTLLRCTQLKVISLSSCRIDDAIVENVVKAIRGHRQLEKLELESNMIRSAGCEALATLIQDPECNLARIDLRNNLIGTDGAITIAKALPKNRKLTGIYLDGNEDISYAGWNAFSKALCNPESINETYLSNHTFCMVASFCKTRTIGSRPYDDDGVIPSRLLSLCELNCISNDKNAVARPKILDCHFNDDFNIEPFVEENMALNVLPYLFGWLGKSSDCFSRSALFHLVRQMPTLCDRPRNVTEFSKSQHFSVAPTASKSADAGHRIKLYPTGLKSKVGDLFRPIFRLNKKNLFGRKRRVYVVDTKTQ
mmetsp:Transcript_30172/g.51371  ORF Transcript_30172/g.51371 Transcript_30172/m.51371 type:complete len:460 (-) Transcript_30172:34-1413(-)